MRILFVSTSSGSHGGGEIFLLFLGRALAARGHRVALWASTHPRMDLLCESFREFGEVLRSDYANTYDRRFRGLWTWSAPRRAVEWIAAWREWKPDLIHLNKQNLEDGLDLLRLVDGAALPTLCTIHLTQPPSRLGAVLGGLRDRIARHGLARYRGPFVVLNQSRAEDLRAFAPLRKSPVLIGNGVRVPEVGEVLRLREEIRRSLGLASHEKLIVGVGRFVPQKRPLVFLEEAIRIRASVPASRFLWIGAAPAQSFAWVGSQTQLGGTPLQETWNQRVAASGMEGAIEIIGWQKEVIPYLAAADLYLHSAAYEGLPFSLLEAMAVGVPVAVSPELADDLNFLDATNSLRLAADLDWRALFHDQDRLSAIGRSGRILIERDYSIARMAEAHERLYGALIEEIAV